MKLSQQLRKTEAELDKVPQRLDLAKSPNSNPNSNPNPNPNPDPSPSPNPNPDPNPNPGPDPNPDLGPNQVQRLHLAKSRRLMELEQAR